jgi:hypothetical protein
MSPPWLPKSKFLTGQSPRLVLIAIGAEDRMSKNPFPELAPLCGRPELAVPIHFWVQGADFAFSKVIDGTTAGTD